ncbi:MAG: glycine--tRNA ligase subunit beta [Rhodoferax sp.]|nr:glycine--tRNA ligase subunit beta [Rhodoferax sp.]
MTTQNLLVELFVEELPPKALKKLGDAFAEGIFTGLEQRDFLSAESAKTAFASPRRLAVHVTDVRNVSQPRPKPPTTLMPASVGLGADGKPTPQLIKRIQTKLYHPEVDIDWVMKERIFVVEENGKQVLKHREDLAAGEALQVGLEGALIEALAKLPIPKVMSYQLESGCELPGWSSVSFVRPAHGLLALHGADVVPVQALGLQAGRDTHGHRFEARVDPVVLRNADSYAQQLAEDGAVIASFEARRAEIVRQLAAAALKAGGGAGGTSHAALQPIHDDALLDEVTALVERPNVLVCAFEPQFLEVPQECLILTMKANQKYFPLLDAKGKLANQFLVVSNITPEDASAVVQGNERVVRPRLADAKFFFDQDRRKSLASRVAQLGKVVYHNKLGTQGERTERVRAIATAIGAALGGDLLATKAAQAASLAKVDLLTDMVGEFPELQGVMGRYYALHDHLPEEVAFAIEDHYRPRFSGDALPRSYVGLAVALADKIETLAGMFGIDQAPTGDRDPYALRRHALGVIRMLMERELPISLTSLVGAGFGSFFLRGTELEDQLVGLIDNQSLVDDKFTAFEHQLKERREQLVVFIYERLAGVLREQGSSAQEVEAVLSHRPQQLGDVPKRLAAVRAFAVLPEAPALAAANKRIGNILKKAPEVDPHVSELLLKEPAEIALFAAMNQVAAQANAQFEAGDYTASLQTLAALRAPVDAFFDGVMVNAEALDLRLNRLGLLKSLHDAMNRVADLSQLAT